ncbi:MAG TPA: hypothetical protein VIQ51_17285, partial [Chryseosolibacter sp.]
TVCLCVQNATGLPIISGMNSLKRNSMIMKRAQTKFQYSRVESRPGKRLMRQWVKAIQVLTEP